MPDDELDEVIRGIGAALGPVPDVPLPPMVLGSPSDDDPELTTAFARPEGGNEPVVDRPAAVATGVPVWDVLGSLKSLLDLVPTGPGDQTRLGQCVAEMRGYFEKDVFPDAAPDCPEEDVVCPISYQRLELNQALDRARQVILGLLDSVEIEKEMRELLSRELQKSLPFLEPDDRGTIGGFVDSTGLTKEKQRNDWKLNALAAFLDALRRQPYVAVRYATRLLSRVAIPPELLSVDPSENTLTFQRKIYTVSDLTCCFVELLISANGQLVSSSEVGEKLKARGLESAGQVRPDRLKGKLPAGLAAAIKTDKRGSRLLVDQLLSHV
jgi:hypothetical protein